ncbi:sorting nexin-29-like [Asterias amurensis]|uniref:sorting nexin-29-like n=1 Tax=Asterias amurensis TaxID=7602 RepID=UPI003AB10AAA
MEHLPQERQHLLDRLLDAVKQCQVRFGGRTELATDSDSRVSCLCAQFEAVLVHGLKRSTSNPLNALKQMTGLNVPNIPLIKTEAEQAFWPVVRENLTKHELQRYTSLKHITTDAGRARAWLRSTLNEHSLERYLHTVLGMPGMLKQYYDPWAFILDEERSSMIPTMARGLGSILFAINIDKEELNGIKQAPSLSSFIQTPEVVHSNSMRDTDLEPVYVVGTASSGGVKDKKEKKKKKKKSAISIVSFNDDDSGSTIVCGSPPSRLHGRSRKNSSGNSDTHTNEVTLPSIIKKTPDLNPNSDQSTSHSSNSVWSQVTAGQTPDQQRTDQSGISSFHNSQSAAEAVQNLPEKRLPVYPSQDGRGDRELPYIIETNQNWKDITNLNQSVPVETGSSQNAPVHNHTVMPTSATTIPEQLNNVYRRDSSQVLATSIPATPPPTPHDASMIAQYEQMVKNTVDPESVADKLRQQERSSKSVSESSSYDVEVGDSPPKVFEVQEEGARKLTAQASFHIIGSADDEVAMYPVNDDSASQQDTQSTDSSMLAFGAETENAALGLLLAQKSLKDSLENTMQPGTPEDTLASYHTMSSDELKQAVLAMMNRNDDLQEQNRSLRSLLDSEMEHSGNVKGQLEELLISSQETEEKLQAQIGALLRENDVLKHQLKKYVGAVQMLRRDGPQAIEGLPGIRVEEQQPAIPDPKPGSLHSDQEAEYERKLIQVAEMHGELMEFNDYLSRQLKQRDNIVKRLRDELVDLRGPLPHDENSIPGAELTDTDSMQSNQRALVNIWIPSAFLRGKGGDAYHVYQIYVRIRDEEWNVYRRYTEFRELHHKMRKTNAIINTFEFPPKKAVGNKDSKFVEGRRKKLQHYIRCVLNFCVSNTAELADNPCKEVLLGILPFFMDEPTRKQSRALSLNKSNKLIAGRKPVPPTPTYDGL